MTSSNPDLQAKALEVHEQLLEAYGEPTARDRDPVDTLVSAIMSQNTNDKLRDRAWRRLRERFPTWEAVRDAPVQDIAEAIKVSGLSKQKSSRIKGALQRLTEEQGKIHLDFLREMDVEQAKGWLTDIKGIGPKTAAITLLFALDMPAFPVDTHVHRVSRRIGLIGDKTSREKAHDDLERILPEKLYYPFHINLIRHGREVCESRRPRCEICIVSDLCDYYAKIT
ncbi:MAG: Endonuclease III [Anaerolineales bacterium]|nr:Endonuclease III [Anaerolineales bacterium]